MSGGPPAGGGGGARVRIKGRKGSVIRFLIISVSHSTAQQTHTRMQTSNPGVHTPLLMPAPPAQKIILRKMPFPLHHMLCQCTCTHMLLLAS